MKLTDDIKKQISDILDGPEFKKDLYEGLDKKTRDRLGMFYTQAKVCIEMLEQFKCESLAGQKILDPTCGSGNLLIACLIAGAGPEALYGNEYDETAVKLCRKRINRACDILGKEHIKSYQIHQGNALQKRCLTDFSEEYITGGISGCHYNPKYIDDLKYAQSTNSWRWENEQAKRRNTKIEVKQVDLFGGLF